MFRSSTGGAFRRTPQWKRDVRQPPEEALAVPVWRWRQAIWWVAAAAIAIGAVAFAYVATRPRPVPKVLKYTQLTSDGNPKWLAGGDASRLFLGTGTLTSLGIAQLSISRGDVSAFPSPVPNLYLLGSSTDGAELLGEEYPANTPDYPGRLWSVPVIGGLPRRVGAMLANDAAWSPDGTMLVYCNRGDLFLANSDGTEARKLASVAGLAYAPQVSPDGARIRFSVMDLNSRGRSLWEVTREGGDLRPLLPGWHTPPEEENGKWTADGKYYVFQSRGQIWALSGSSGFGRSLTVPSQLTDSPLSLSSPWPGKDGKRLFVVGRTQRGELSRYSGAAREFLPFLSGVSAQGVDFSRDGRSIAFVTYPEGVLWCSRTDGSQRVRLSNPPLYPIMPRWSPDGRQVVFWGFTPGKPTRLYRVGAKGGDVAALLPEDQDRLEDPNWSPDGDRIVFARDPSPRGPLTIQVLNLADGRSVVLPGSTNLASPRWSPDGRHLVAMRRDALGLMLFDFHTNKWSPLVSMPVGYPSWSRDGQYVYFLRVPDNPAVLRVRLSDRVVERVVDLKSVPMTGFLGPWLGLAPDGSPLVLRDWSSQDIYALEWDAR